MHSILDNLFSLLLFRDLIRPAELEERGVLWRSSFFRSYYIYSAAQNWGSGSARETTRGRRSHASSLHLSIIHCASFLPFHIVYLLIYSFDICFAFFVENERKTATAQQGVYAFFVSTWTALCLFFWEPFNEKRRRSRMLAIRLYICVFCYSWGGCVNCTLFGSALADVSQSLQYDDMLSHAFSEPG